ncbi:MAG: glycosyltransferase, partial [Oceanobacter sp.]
FHNQTSATLVPTKIQRDQLESSGYRNVSVMARGVDSELFNPSRRNNSLRKKWGVRADDLVLLYVGRIAGEKNLGLALSTYERLSETDEQVKLVLVGDGPELPTIRQQFPEAIFCGMKTGIDLAEHYASGDIFLFPSKTDTFGNVVTEAMASGLAVVSFDYAAAHEHIQQGENGLVVPFGDDEAYIRCATTLIDSPNLLASIRKQARQTAMSISWDSIVDDFITRLSAGAPVKVSSHDNRKTEHGKNRITVQ